MRALGARLSGSADHQLTTARPALLRAAADASSLYTGRQTTPLSLYSTLTQLTHYMLPAVFAVMNVDCSKLTVSFGSLKPPVGSWLVPYLLK